MCWDSLPQWKVSYSNLIWVDLIAFTWLDDKHFPFEHRKRMNKEYILWFKFLDLDPFVDFKFARIRDVKFEIFELFVDLLGGILICFSTLLWFCIIFLSIYDFLFFKNRFWLIFLDTFAFVTLGPLRLRIVTKIGLSSNSLLRCSTLDVIFILRFKFIKSPISLTLIQFKLSLKLLCDNDFVFNIAGPISFSQQVCSPNVVEVTVFKFRFQECVVNQIYASLFFAFLKGNFDLFA